MFGLAVAGLDRRQLVEREPRARDPRGDLGHLRDVLEVVVAMRRRDPLRQRASDRALDQVADRADRAAIVDEHRCPPRQRPVGRRDALRDVVVEVAEQLGPPRRELRPGGGLRGQLAADPGEVDLHPRRLGVARARAAASRRHERVIADAMVRTLAKPRVGVRQRGRRAGGREDRQDDRSAHLGTNEPHATSIQEI
jgi:hypothetical protein